MEATYQPVSFEAEDAKHSRCIESLIKYYEGKLQFKKLPGKNQDGCDLLMKHKDVVSSIEIKSNAGVSAKGFSYPTWLVETYCDYEQTQLSGWAANKNLDNLIIFNLHTKKAYIYDANTLRNYVKKHLYNQQPAGTGTGQYNKADKKCSWGLRLPWACVPAGFLKEIDLGEYLADK